MHFIFEQVKSDKHINNSFTFNNLLKKFYDKISNRFYILYLIIVMLVLNLNFILEIHIKYYNYRIENFLITYK